MRSALKDIRLNFVARYEQGDTKDPTPPTHIMHEQNGAVSETASHDLMTEGYAKVVSLDDDSGHGDWLGTVRLDHITIFGVEWVDGDDSGVSREENKEALRACLVYHATHGSAQNDSHYPTQPSEKEIATSVLRALDELSHKKLKGTDITLKDVGYKDIENFPVAVHIPAKVSEWQVTRDVAMGDVLIWNEPVRVQSFDEEKNNTAKIIGWRRVEAVVAPTPVCEIREMCEIKKIAKTTPMELPRLVVLNSTGTDPLPPGHTFLAPGRNPEVPVYRQEWVDEKSRKRHLLKGKQLEIIHDNNPASKNLWTKSKGRAQTQGM